MQNHSVPLNTAFRAGLERQHVFVSSWLGYQGQRTGNERLRPLIVYCDNSTLGCGHAHSPPGGGGGDLQKGLECMFDSESVSA